MLKGIEKADVLRGSENEEVLKGSENDEILKGSENDVALKVCEECEKEDVLCEIPGTVTDMEVLSVIEAMGAVVVSDEVPPSVELPSVEEEEESGNRKFPIW